MNSTTHDELLEWITELRRALPSMRFGQLMANLATIARGANQGAIWDVEDEELISAIRWQLKQLASEAGEVDTESASAPDLAVR